MTDAIDDPVEREAAKLRNALVDRLVETGIITTPPVEQAFRTVPRHLFVPPGTPLDATYDVDRSLPTKVNEHGVTISAISATYIQARMIEQAEVGPGDRVLEIGSGGPNAALLAEVVGPRGSVVSIDIDPDVIDQARDRLAATGYLDRIELILADGERDLRFDSYFDHIVVTVGAWDIPPAWPRQLAPDGNIVVPLRMNGVTRSLGLHQVGEHLESRSAEVCGFVAMQGAGEHNEHVIQLPDRQGHAVSLRFDNNPPAEPHRLHGALTHDPELFWSGVTIERSVSFADLHLWLAWFLPGFCLLAVDEETVLAGERGKTWFPFGGVDGESLTILAVRPAPDGDSVEFGARAYGPTAAKVAGGLVGEIQAWDRQGRGDPPPAIAFWPTGTTPVPGTGRTSMLHKTHGILTISWPEPA